MLLQIVTQMAVVLLASAKTMPGMLEVNVTVSIATLAVLAGKHKWPWGDTFLV